MKHNCIICIVVYLNFTETIINNN